MKMRVKIDDKSFDVEIDDLQSRPILAVVDGETLEVWPEEAAPAAGAESEGGSAEAAPMAATAPAPEAADLKKAVLAPIPGTIVAVLVKEGDSVKFGQELVTLEAMKMKNAIRATRDAKVAVVHVNVGDQVRHSQVLVEYAD
jgi:biotin carboxyl carrier protein